MSKIEILPLTLIEFNLVSFLTLKKFLWSLFCFSCFISELESVINIHLPDSTEPETCIQLKRKDEEEMRIVGVSKSKGLHGYQEVRGFSDF